VQTGVYKPSIELFILLASWDTVTPLHIVIAVGDLRRQIARLPPHLATQLKAIQQLNDWLRLFIGKPLPEIVNNVKNG
jgi:hypothetical protein